MTITHIALTYAVLNNLPIFTFDMHNACLQAPSCKNYYVICSPELGLENNGKHEIIVRALRGGKSSGAGY